MRLTKRICLIFSENTLLGCCALLPLKYRPLGMAGRNVKELPGAISQGETLGELKVNMTDAIQLMLESIYEEAHEKKKMEIEVSV
jgi:hypothetical protein